MNKEYLNELSFGIIGCAMRVHDELGPGLLESVYQECMIYELFNKGYRFKIQESVPLNYDNICLKSRLRLDILVEDAVIIEIKSVDVLHDVHKKQLLTYLKLSGKKVGFLVNFNASHLTDKESLIRIVNNF